MATEFRARSTSRRTVIVGHLFVGAATLVFAAVMIRAGLAPNAEMEGGFFGLGIWVALIAGYFLFLAVLVVQRSREGRGDGLSLSLSIVELLAGAAMAAGVAVAVPGYGAFEPWRSPLFLPATLLVALGLTGIGLAIRSHRP